jgi:AbiTii
MAGLVEEIQAQALDPTVRVSDLLRRVKLAAVKLQLDDAIEWVDRELRGYATPEVAPSYRQTTGQLRAHTPYHGVQPVTGDAPWIKEVCNSSIGDSIAKVEILAGDGTQEVIGKVDGRIETAMNKANRSPGTEYYVHTPQSVLLDILEQVRNLVLDWAIGLEKAGILGEGLSFTMEEKKKAANAGTSISIENFTGNIHQGDVTGHQNRTIVASTDNSENIIDISNVFQKLVQTVERDVSDKTDREAVLDIVRNLEATRLRTH